MRELKPNKLSFLFSWLTFTVFFIGLLILSILVLSWSWKWLPFLIILFLVFLAFLYDLWRYKKEKYIIEDKKIVRHYGDWFSDNSVEILYNKIVEVKLTLPFWQHLFFKTGNISIQTAGGWNIYILSIENTTDVYNEIISKMNNAWYNLWDGDLVIETKPSTLWVFGEVFVKLTQGQGIVTAIYLVIIINKAIKDWLINNNIIFSIWWTVLFIFALVFFFTYMDYKKRVYKLYTDRIEYYEWFLTKHHAIIPIEMVSDIENSQSFLSRILWIHDLVISAKGATNNIVFLNILNWEKFIESVKYIKDKIDENTIKSEKSKENVVKHKNKIETPVEYDRWYTDVFKMSKKKIIVSSLLFIVFPPAFIVIVIIRLFYAIFTKYKVDTGALEYTFDFLSKKHASFKVENITKVTFSQSILDKILKTWTVRFYSIWASSALAFRDIAFSDELKEKLLKKVGISNESIVKEVKADFNFKNFIFSNLVLIFLLILVGIFLWVGSRNIFIWFLWAIILFGIFYLYNYYLYNKYYSANVRETYIEVRKWILIENHSFALINNIKWITSVKIPFSQAWNLFFNIAWETISTSNKGSYILSNTISFNYVPNVFAYHDAFDKYLNNWELDIASEILSKPALINVVLPTIIIGIFTVLLGIWVVILLVFLPYIIWATKVQYYNIQKDRILYAWWIIYKSRKTILKNKIDVVQMDRWFLNKMFGNGNVDIYTTWSTNIDMRIKNINDYQKVYELLKEELE